MLVRGPGTGVWILLIKGDTGSYTILLRFSGNVTESKAIDKAKGLIDGNRTD